MEFIKYTLLTLLLTMNRSSCDQNFFNVKKAFFKDFFNNDMRVSVNFYGCLNRKQRFDFEKRITEDAPARIVSFINSVAILKNMKMTWMVADGIGCKVLWYLKEIYHNEMFRSPFRHLILLAHKEYKYYLEALESFEILPMSEVLIALLKDEDVSLFYIYKIRNESHTVIENFGVWTKRDGFELTMQQNVSISSRRRNFQKYPINYGTVIFKDLSVLNTNFDDILETPEFYFQQEMPIFYSLFQALNATIQINIYKYHGHGGINKSTGKLIVDGLVGDLYKKKIDISSGLYVSRQRLDLLKPLSPVDFWGLKFFLKKPSLSSMKNIYVLTLSKSVWKASLAMVVLFVGAIYLALKLESQTSDTYKEKMEQGILAQEVNISSMILLCFEAVGQQGTSILSFRVSGRCLLLLLVFLFMFLFVAYSAGILVLLKSTTNINSLNELLESRFDVGGLNDTWMRHYFQAPKTGVLRKLYLKKIYPNNYYEKIDGWEKIQEGNFAFFAPVVISYRYFIENFTNYDICALQELDGFLSMKSYASASRTSGYEEIFKVWLLNLQERGVAKRAKIRIARKPKCNNQAGSFQSVRILDCIWVLLIFAYGSGLSMIVFMMEHLYKKYFLHSNT